MGVADPHVAKWIFRLDRNYAWRSPFPLERDWAFQDSSGQTRLLLETDGTITVTSGYAWDGCTPKTFLLNLVVGTPDGVVDTRTGWPRTYHASLVHDALYQFLPDGLPLTRAQADRCFLELMKETDFVLRYLYYAAVRLFGGFTLPVTRRIRRTSGGQGIELP